MRGAQTDTNHQRAMEESLRIAASSLLAAGETCGTRTQVVLAEVYELLEDFAPVWYSTKLRGRILNALKASGTTR